MLAQLANSSYYILNGSVAALLWSVVLAISSDNFRAGAFRWLDVWTYPRPNVAGTRRLGSSD